MQAVVNVISNSLKMRRLVGASVGGTLGAALLIGGGATLLHFRLKPRSENEDLPARRLADLSSKERIEILRCAQNSLDGKKEFQKVHEGLKQVDSAHPVASLALSLAVVGMRVVGTPGAPSEETLSLKGELSALDLPVAKMTQRFGVGRAVRAWGKKQGAPRKLVAAVASLAARVRTKAFKARKQDLLTEELRALSTVSLESVESVAEWKEAVAKLLELGANSSVRSLIGKAVELGHLATALKGVPVVRILGHIFSEKSLSQHANRIFTRPEKAIGNRFVAVTKRAMESQKPLQEEIHELAENIGANLQTLLKHVSDEDWRGFLWAATQAGCAA